jgi:hypothetical protein
MSLGASHMAGFPRRTILVVRLAMAPCAAATLDGARVVRVETCTEEAKKTALPSPESA